MGFAPNAKFLVGGKEMVVGENNATASGDSRGGRLDLDKVKIKNFH
jgi:hypothetical protein